MTPTQKAEVSALVFGMGTVLDLRGHSVFHPHGQNGFGSISSDFRRVGEFFAIAMDAAQAEVTEHAAKQMPLKLNA